MDQAERPFHVVQSVELGAPAAAVWDVVGGFYTIHLWHPDIEKTEVPARQTDVGPLRRELTFPGQPITVEELRFLDTDDRRYRYRWYSGAWGERVKQYIAEIRVLDLDPGSRSLLHWSSTFVCTEDAVSEFYQRGLQALVKRFTAPGK